MISLEFCQKVDLNWIGAFFLPFLFSLNQQRLKRSLSPQKLVWFFWTEKRWKPWCSIVNTNQSVFWSSSGERSDPIRLLSPSQSIHQLLQFPFKGLMKNLGKRGGKKNIPSILEADSDSWAPAATDTGLPLPQPSPTHPPTHPTDASQPWTGKLILRAEGSRLGPIFLTLKCLGMAKKREREEKKREKNVSKMCKHV